MDTSYTYPHLFDIDEPFDADLFHGLSLQEVISSPNNENKMYNIVDSNINRKLTNTQHEEAISDIYNSFASANHNSYLRCLQTNQNTQQDFFYDPSSIYQPQIIPTIGLNLDIPEYDYLQQQQTLPDQKLQYNWLYDPNDTYLANNTDLFCEETMMTSIMPTSNLDCIMSENETITVEGGLSRGYVSLSDVNSFVAKADSVKHSCLLLSDNLLLDDFALNQTARRSFSSSESTNEDSEDEYSDNNSELDLRWPHLTTTSYSTPTSNSTKHNKTNARQKLMIKIKKPSHMSGNLNSALPSPYGEPHWDLVAPKTSRSTSYRNSKQHRKSMSNIYNMKKKNTAKTDSKARRGSVPHRMTLHNSHSNASLNSLHSSSSLSSLSNNLQRSVRVSDSLASFLSDAEDEEAEDDAEHVEDEDEDDEEYQQIRSTSAYGNHGQLAATKKGRNVDKACNHCKRSHLRCDDMRPCRRCVATGKTGCKDVQHKPRGRPKLHKK